MTKEEVLQHVQGVIDAPSAYAGLKDVAKDYLASIGKADEKAKAEKLIAALNECVCSIDDVLPPAIAERDDNRQTVVGLSHAFGLFYHLDDVFGQAAAVADDTQARTGFMQRVGFFFEVIAQKRHQPLNLRDRPVPVFG